MAPPIIPTEVKRRRGTLRADRPGGKSVTPSSVAVARAPITTPPPDDLNDAGKAEWVRALQVCPWIALSDLAILKLLCDAIDLRERFKKELVTAPLQMQSTTGFWYTNPLIPSLRKTEEQITKWMTQLGMTPSARGALGVAEVTAASTLDKLAARRAQRQAGLPGTSPPLPESP